MGAPPRSDNRFVAADSEDRLDRLQIESDIRFRIDELYREGGIVIAFPQRDVHLDSVSPVEVRIVNGEEKQDAHET